MRALGGPSKLNNYYIQRLAVNLLTSNWLDAKEREIALRLLNYNDKSRVSEKWIFLAIMYRQINNMYSVMAKTIITLFETNFEHTILTILERDSPEVAAMTRSQSGSAYMRFSIAFIAEHMQLVVHRHYYYNSEQMGAYPISEKNFDNEQFRYYKFLKIFVKNQINYINNSQDAKSIALASILKQIRELKDSPEDLKELITPLRKVCSEHRDNMFIRTLKFNFFTPTRSVDILNSLFDESGELYVDLRSTDESLLRVNPT